MEIISGEGRRHYRDPDLTDEQALAAMLDMSNELTAHVLSARRDLLALGLADSHPVLQWLDHIAMISTEMVERKRLPLMPFTVKPPFEGSVVR